VIAKNNEEGAGSFQRRIYKCLFGAIKENGKWRRSIWNV
jgi:hypothetical protein